MVTMGYGPYYPFVGEKTDIALFVLATIQQFVGVVINVLVFTLIVTKIQHPTAAIVFSEKALLTTRNGNAVLLFRIGNLRCNHIYMPQVRLSLLRAESTAEGENFMRWVSLLTTEIPVVTAAVVIEHKILPGTPLYDDFFPPAASTDGSGHNIFQPQRFLDGLERNTDFALSLTFMGRDSIYFDEISSAHRYFRDDLLFGRLRFADVMEAREERGKTSVVANFEKLGSFVPMDGRGGDEDGAGDHAAALEDAATLDFRGGEQGMGPVECSSHHLAETGRAGSKRPSVDGDGQCLMGSVATASTEVGCFSLLDNNYIATSASDIEGDHLPLPGPHPISSLHLETCVSVAGLRLSDHPASLPVPKPHLAPEKTEFLKKLALPSKVDAFGTTSGTYFGEIAPEWTCLHPDLDAPALELQTLQPGVVYLFCGGDQRGRYSEKDILGVGHGHGGVLTKCCSVSVVVDSLLKASRIPHQTWVVDLVEKPRFFREISPLGEKASTPLVIYEGRVISESKDILEFLVEEFGDSHMKRYLELPVRAAPPEVGVEGAESSGTTTRAGEGAQGRGQGSAATEEGGQQKTAGVPSSSVPATARAPAGASVPATAGASSPAKNLPPTSDQPATVSNELPAAEPPADFHTKFAVFHTLKPVDICLPSFVFAAIFQCLFQTVKIHMVLQHLPAALRRLGEIDREIPDLVDRNAAGVVLPPVAAALTQERTELEQKIAALRKTRDEELPQMTAKAEQIWGALDAAYEKKRGSRWLHGERLSLDDVLVLSVMASVRSAVIMMYPMRKVGWPPRLGGGLSSSSGGGGGGGSGTSAVAPASGAAGQRRAIAPNELDEWDLVTVMNCPSINAALDAWEQTDLYRAVFPGPRWDFSRRRVYTTMLSMMSDFEKFLKPVPHFGEIGVVLVVWFCGDGDW